MTSRKDSRPALPPVIHVPQPAYRVAPLGEIRIHLVSDAELDSLEAGPPEGLQLNFALALLPVAATILITLQTVEIASNRVYVAHLVAFWLFFIQGLISLLRWWRSRGSTHRIVEKIRNRMPPPEATQEPTGLPPDQS